LLLETQPEFMISCGEFSLQDFWDFSLTADRPICHNWPDIVVLDKQIKRCYFVDVAIPGDTCVKLRKVGQVS